MNRFEIARRWVESPNGQRWAIERVQSDLAAQPSIENHSDSEVEAAVAVATSPTQLVAELMRNELVVLGGISFDGVSIATTAGDEPWVDARFTVAEVADMLGSRRDDVVADFIRLRQDPMVPDLVLGWEVVILDLRRWLRKERVVSADTICRQLMETRPAGRKWVLTASRSRATVHGLPLVFVAGTKGSKSVYDPIEIIEAIEAELDRG